jgi:hypothetical protein
MYTRDKLNMLKFPGLYIYIYVGFCMRNPNLRSKTATYLHIHREISNQECIYIYRKNIYTLGIQGSNVLIKDFLLIYIYICVYR